MDREPFSRRAIVQIAALAAVGGIAAQGEALAQTAPSRTGYARVDDGHRVYFETYGPAGGVPIVLLHGGATSIDTVFPDFIARFARTRPVIAIEQQGHGHTADRAGPLRLDHMVEDTAGVLAHLNVAQADMFGHSMGGMIATGMAIRYPARVRTLTALSAGYRLEGMLLEVVEMAELIPDSQLAILPGTTHMAIEGFSHRGD